VGGAVTAGHCPGYEWAVGWWEGKTCIKNFAPLENSRQWPLVFLINETQVGGGVRPGEVKKLKLCAET
jgi:hypothetical protein